MSSFSERLTTATNQLHQIFTEEEILSMQRKSLVKQFKKGEVILEEGNFCKGVYVVNSGKVKIFQHGPFGKESLITLNVVNDFFGLAAMLSEQTSVFSASAMDDCSLTFISRETFMELYDRSTLVRRKVTLHLVSEQSMLINKLTVLAQYPVKQKVAASLIMLNAIFSRSGAQAENVFNISRDDLASYTGIATESVVRALRILKDEYIISTKGARINILNPAALAQIVNDCHSLKNERSMMQ
jgi:CRP-like cAMP-binding protein